MHQVVKVRLLRIGPCEAVPTRTDFYQLFYPVPVSSSSRCNKPCLDTKLALSQEIQSNTRLSDPPSPQSSDEPGPGIQGSTESP